MEGATFSARNKKINFDYCSVRDCNSKASEDLELRFHIFPTIFIFLGGCEGQKHSCWERGAGS